MKLSLSISPCPNDTFMFEAMLNGRVDTEGLRFEVKFADIEELNQSVVGGKGSDVSKVSYAVLSHITEQYSVLNSGSALGKGNGPLLVSGRKVDTNDQSLRIAIPGEYTTANALMQRLFPHLTDRTPVLFSEIAERVGSGEFDAGVLIHEGRFTYGEKGLQFVADLGELWEQATAMPLPLGAIVVSRELPQNIQRMIGRVLRRSIEYAFENPMDSVAFVRNHAQELSDEVTRSHIELFVNDYSIDLGSIGRRAVMQFSGLDDEKAVFVESV